jgi:hypothetical protein
MKKLLICSLYVYIYCTGSIWSQSLSIEISDITLPPVFTFEENCSRCHGHTGSAYGEHFADLKYDSLKNIITDMMIGPAGLSPDSIEIEAMVTYNQFINKHKPFATVINAKSFLDGKTDTLLVETSLNAKLRVNNQEVKINKGKEFWEIIFPLKSISPVVLTVVKEVQSASIIFPEAIWTK